MCLPSNSPKLEEEEGEQLLEPIEVILESVKDEAEVKANRELIWQKKAKVDSLFDKLEAEKATEEAGAKQSEGTELHLRHIYPSKGTKIADISDEE
ncbi:hypothetical protein D1007_23562 [Hordeum vulgare]|nr:hypothetical protein D1007_23562 [Hordeum vulgare]